MISLTAVTLVGPRTISY